MSLISKTLYIIFVQVYARTADSDKEAIEKLYSDSDALTKKQKTSSSQKMTKTNLGKLHQTSQ